MFLLHMCVLTGLHFSNVSAYTRFRYFPELIPATGPLGCSQQRSSYAEMAANSRQTPRLLQGDRFEPRLQGDALFRPLGHDTSRDPAKVPFLHAVQPAVLACVPV